MATNITPQKIAKKLHGAFSWFKEKFANPSGEQQDSQRKQLDRELNKALGEVKSHPQVKNTLHLPAEVVIVQEEFQIVEEGESIDKEIIISRAIHSLPVDYDYMGQIPIAATVVLSELARQYNPQALMQIVEKVAHLGETKSETAYGRDLTAYAVFLYKMINKKGNQQNG